jgi:hypothetical protein
VVHNIEILRAIPSTEPATFGEFCSAYDDCPERGDREGWRELFGDLETLEQQGLVEIERVDGKIESLQLTGEGAELVCNER